jgi:hypothetical protein
MPDLFFAVTIPENGQTTIAVQGRGTGSLGLQTLLYFPDNRKSTLAKTKTLTNPGNNCLYLLYKRFQLTIKLNFSQKSWRPFEI